MPQLFSLTEDAVRDLEQTVAYIAEDSEEAAHRLADTLDHAFHFIARWPNCGHRRPELTLQERVRFWSSAGYLIAYRADIRPVLILAVLHGARDAESIFTARLEDR